MQEIYRVTTDMSGLARKETLHSKQGHRAIAGAEQPGVLRNCIFLLGLGVGE